MTKREEVVEAARRLQKAANKCLEPGCNAPGILEMEDGRWLCGEHMCERLDVHVAQTEAGWELDEFRAAGGKLSWQTDGTICSAVFQIGTGSRMISKPCTRTQRRQGLI